MIFFTDRDLGGLIFPGILAAAGVHVERHADHFEPDADWLPAVAARHWVILSNDQRILRRPVELDAIRLSGARVIVLVGGGAPARQAAKNFLNTLPKVETFLGRSAPPLIAKLYRPSPALLIGAGNAGPHRAEEVLVA